MRHRLLFKTITFGVGMWILLNILGSLGDHVAPKDIWQVNEQARYASLMNRRNQIQAISLGNSHGDAIDFQALGLEGQSLARAAADLFEVERYSASVADRLPSLQMAFVTLSYYSFSRDNSTLDNMRIRRIALYAMLPTWLPTKGDWANLLLGKLHVYSRIMSVARSDNWYNVLHHIPKFSVTDNLPQPTPQFAGVKTVTLWGECSHFSTSELEAHSRDIGSKNAASSRAMAKAHPGLQEKALEALAQTIERLQDHGIRVILFTPPYYQLYTANFTEQASEIIDHMRWTIHQLQEKYQVEYYDFSNDRKIVTRPELFLNSDHVNDCGRKAFSERLLQAMLETGNLSSLGSSSK